MKHILNCLIIISFSLGTFAQNKVDEALQTYYSQWQKGQPTTNISESLLNMDQKDVLDMLDRFTKDTSEDKRLATYKLISNLGLKSTNTSTRKQAVKQLITGCNDKDGGIIGVNMKNLTLFSVQDFEAESKYLLSEMTKKPMPYYELLIKICGWLGIKDISYDFRQAIEQKKGTVKQRWAMRLAMSRLGETDMADYCVQRVTKIPVNDDVVYDLVPDMIYTRQKSMFDYLFQIIESDEKKCSSPNPDSNAKILCAYRVMEQIAPYIENFPVEVSASGDLKTKDYEKALQDVRSWFKVNKESYVIKKEEF